MSRLTKWPFGGAVLSTAHFSKTATMEFFHQVATKKTLRLRNETRGDADISFQRVVAGANGGGELRDNPLHKRVHSSCKTLPPRIPVEDIIQCSPCAVIPLAAGLRNDTRPPPPPCSDSKSGALFHFFTRFSLGT